MTFCLETSSIELMFKNLTNLKSRRNTKEAFGFYLAYLVFIILLAMIVGAILGAVSAGGSDLGIGADTITGIVVTLALAYAIVKKKKLMSNFANLLLVLLSGVLAYYGGGLIGLIPVAYLTTKAPKK